MEIDSQSAIESQKRNGKNENKKGKRFIETKERQREKRDGDTKRKEKQENVFLSEIRKLL